MYSQVGLALAYFSCNRFQESYSIYDSCFHWLANKDGLKSDILVAMGILAYKVEGVQSAKTLLFQSCQLHPPSVRGILALCVIGIQSSDLNLIDAALSEMKVHENDQRHAHDIAFLRASVMLLKVKKAYLKTIFPRLQINSKFRVMALVRVRVCSGLRTHNPGCPVCGACFLFFFSRTAQLKLGLLQLFVKGRQLPLLIR